MTGTTSSLTGTSVAFLTQPEIAVLGTPCPSVALRGEIDMANEYQVREVLKSAVDASATDQILVDCHNIDFIDSMGISALFKGQKYAQAKHRKLVLVGPSPRVLNVLRVCGLLDKFEVAPVIPVAHS